MPLPAIRADHGRTTPQQLDVASFQFEHQNHVMAVQPKPLQGGTPEHGSAAPTTCAGAIRGSAGLPSRMLEISASTTSIFRWPRHARPARLIRTTRSLAEGPPAGC